MTTLTYEIVEHDGGWAYRVDETISEPFKTRDAARWAADLAAHEQSSPGESTRIEFEDESGVWHIETSPANDRPKTRVRG